MRFITRTLNRLRTEARDSLVLFVLPVLLVILPWKTSWRLTGLVCRSTPLFTRQAKNALNNCRQHLPIADEQQWLADHRRNILLDHVDIWLSMLAPWKLRKRIIRRGDFPQNRAFVVIGTHWNTGFAVLHQLRACNHQVVYILRKRERKEFQGRLVEYLYVSLRRRHLEKLFPGRRYTPGSYPRKIIKAFQNNESVLVLADVPAAPGEQNHRIKVCDQPVRLSSGLVNVVIKMQINCVFFRVVIDQNSGHRVLELEQNGIYQDSEALYDDLQVLLQRNLNEDSAAWHLWPVAGQFFRKR